MSSNPAGQPGVYSPALEANLARVRLIPALNLVTAKDSAGALWFTLDEIEAVARSIDLVVEHVEDGPPKTGRIFALVRAVCELVGTAKSMQQDIETDLNAV